MKKILIATACAVTAFTLGACTSKTAYQSCIDQAAKIDASLKSCVQTALAAKGYADGIDCTQNPQTPPCTNIDRYNAEADANNGCLTSLGITPASPNVIACQALNR